MREGIVILPEFVANDYIESFIVGQERVIDMNAILRDVLLKNAFEFCEASELLAVRFPSFQDTIDDSRCWLANCYNAQWADEDISLAECYAAEIQGPNLARYRIVSYVEYVVPDDFWMPTAVIKSWSLRR